MNKYHLKDKEVAKEELWFLDSRCNIHICGNRESSAYLDENFMTMVTFRDNSSMVVMEKGGVQISIYSITLILIDMLYFLELCIGQLVGKGLKILI